jgi:DNA-binding CsgD family transcriptional regulator
MTPEQIDRMAAWREAGKSYAWIGRRLGYSKGLIRWNCLKVGADRPDGSTIAPSRMPMLTTRGNHQVRRFSPEEDAELLGLATAGRSTAEIARALGRRTNSITGRLMTLAMWDARREAQGPSQLQGDV